MPKKGTRSRELGPDLKKNFQVPEVPQKRTRSRNSVQKDRVLAQPWAQVPWVPHQFNL